MQKRIHQQTWLKVSLYNAMGRLLIRASHCIHTKKQTILILFYCGMRFLLWDKAGTLYSTLTEIVNWWRQVFFIYMYVFVTRAILPWLQTKPPQAGHTEGILSSLIMRTWFSPERKSEAQCIMKHRQQFDYECTGWTNPLFGISSLPLFMFQHI